MNSEIINPIDYPDWNQQISNVEGANIFHTSNWAKVLFDCYGYEPKYFCSIENSAVTNLIPLMEISSYITGKRGVALPFSDQVEPLVSEPYTFNELFRSIVSFGQEKKWKNVVFHGGNGFFNAEPYITYIASGIEINDSYGTLHDGLKSSTRRNIKKALRSGLSANIYQTKESVTDFYRLNCLSRKDHGLPPQPFHFFAEIGIDIISKGAGFVCLAMLKNIPIAGVVFFYFNKKAIYKYGASDRRYWQFRPNDLAMWEAIRWCAENGIQYIDLGRTDIDQTGLLQFKRNWNSIEKELNYYKFSLQKNAFISDKPKIRSSYPFFQKLPMPLLRIIGRLLYKHLA